MRLFAAIDPPSHVQLRLDELIRVLRLEAALKWSLSENLHITTKFIGEWPEAQLPQLEERLALLVRREPFDLQLGTLGWFPNAGSPRVLWLGVHGGGPLSRLAADTESELRTIGIPAEARAFSPHLTLARIKMPVPLERLRQKIAQLQPAFIGSFSVSGFALYHSEPGSRSSTYRKLGTYPFQSPVEPPAAAANI